MEQKRIVNKKDDDFIKKFPNKNNLASDLERWYYLHFDIKYNKSYNTNSADTDTNLSKK